MIGAAWWLAAACSEPTPTPTPGAQSPGEAVLLEDADLVAAADVDGDGIDELVRVVGSTARWSTLTWDLGGSPQRAARGRIGGRDTALIATGSSRDDRDAPARVWAISELGATLLYERATPRAQVPTLAVIDGRVWIAVYADDRTVEAGWLSEGRLEVVSSGRMAEAQLPIGSQVAVGRVYGDKPLSNGDLRLQPSGTVLPTLRGVRGLGVADLDEDGTQDLIVADGWHQNYGQVADGRLLLLRGPDFLRGSLIAHFAQDYTASDFSVSGTDILVSGPARVHLLRRDIAGWVDFDLGVAKGNAVFVTTPEGPAAFIAGQPARLVPL